MEHALVITILGFLSGAITVVGNEFFNQGWGLGVFLVIWLITLVVSYGGFLILDGDDIF